MSRIHKQFVVTSVIALLGIFVVEVAVAISLAPRQTETRSFALIVSNEPNGPSRRLARLLEQRYGFEVEALLGPQSTRSNIDETMYKLAESVGPYDQLFVFISLPILRDPDLYYLPADANRRDRWQHLSWENLQRWLISLDVGPTLITYPTCNQNTSSSNVEPGIESLTYSLGRRRSALEVAMICDREVMRTARREPRGGFSDWRSEVVANEIYQRLKGEIQTRGADNLSAVELDAVSLLREVSRRQRSGILIKHLTVPLYQEPKFRFVPIEEENAYENRYSSATSFDSLSDVFMDYQSASNKNADLQTSFIAFAGSVAASEDAATELELSERETYQIRRNAISALKQRSKADEARDQLNKIALTAIDSAAIRRNAIASLGSAAQNFRDSDLAVYQQATTDVDASVREAAYVALAQSSAPDVADILVAAYATEASASARRVILLALPKFGRTEDAELYFSALEDDNSAVRTQAVAAFSSLPPSSSITKKLARHFTRETDARVLTTLVYTLSHSVTAEEKEAVTQLLINGLQQHTDKHVRVAIATTLGDFAGSQTTTALIGLLRNARSTDVASAAAKSLGQLKAIESVPSLSAVVLDNQMEIEKPLLVVAAVKALGEIDSPESAKTVWEKLEAADDLRIREAAQLALAKMTFDPDTTKEKITSRSELVRESAIAQASSSTHPDAQAILLEGLADDDDQVQDASIRGLAASQLSNLVQPIEDAYDKGTTRVKVNLIKALGTTNEIDTPWVTKKIIEATQSRSLEVRVTAVEALGKIQSKQSLEALIAASRDRNDAVRNAAIIALGNHDSAEAQERLKQIVRESRVKTFQKSAIESINKQNQIERIDRYRKK